METLEQPLAEALTESTQWDDPIPPNIEEQKFDILAFELWQRASRQDVAADEDCPEVEDEVAGRASCL